jgi:twinkle protein
MISENSISEVKAKMDIYEVVSEVVKLKKVGTDYVGLCPFHNEKSGSFKIKVGEQFYKCFGCGQSGDAIKFLQEHKKISFIDAITLLAEKYHVPLEDVNPTKPKVKPISNPLPLTINQYEFFAKRKIDTKTIEYFRITNEFTYMPKAGGNANAICFNYFRGDELINVKYRGAGKDFKMAANAELIFYNLNAIVGKENIVIVEGELDCMSVHQVGITNVVSVPNGANGGTARLEYLDNCYDAFKDAKNIVLMTDNDAPGIALRDELARRLGFDKCLKVVFPNDCKDANEILMKHGEDVLSDCIVNAVEFPIMGVLSAESLFPDVWNYYQNGYPSGVKVGIPNVDEYISFMLGQFTTITGIPGSGKSEFVDYLMTMAAKKHDWKFAVCSFENQPSALHVTKLMEKHAGKSFAHRENVYNRISPTEFENSLNFVNEHFYFVNINQIEVTLEGILSKAKELVSRKGINALLIDPWNYIEHKHSSGQTETQYISECLTTIKSFCLSNMVHVFLIAHPVKLAKEGGKYVVPTLYNISGSAHFFNKTDNGITVYRDFETGIVDIYFQKIRYSWLGKIGKCSFTYNLETRQYEAVEEPKQIF